MANTVNLQGIGKVKARPASEIKVGDRVMFNGGVSYEVVQVYASSEKSVKVTFATGRTGGSPYVKGYDPATGLWTRCILKASLVASWTPKASTN